MRKLTDDEVKELLELKLEDITNTRLKSYFGRTLKRPEPRFTVEDYFMLPENACSKNLPGLTNIGLFMFNKLVTDKYFADVTGYVNTPITSKVLNKIYNRVSDAFFNDKIEVEAFYFMINMLEWIGGGDLAELLNISLTNNLFILPKEVKDVRDKLFKDNAQALASGDINVSAKVESEIVNSAKNYMQQLPEWENFASGAKLDFDNSYKTMMLVKGPVLNNGTGEWEFLQSNYNDGIKKSEYAKFADSSVAGVYSRAKGVAIGGYTVKKFIATLQEVVAAKEGSDCGTTHTLSTYIDPYFIQTFIGMNIKEGSKVINLNSDTIGKYIGKRVNLFSPMYCKYPVPELCSKCIGTHAYKMNLRPIGLASTKMGSTLMQKSLKAFHSKKVFLYETEIDDLFGEFGE